MFKNISSKLLSVKLKTEVTPETCAENGLRIATMFNLQPGEILVVNFQDEVAVKIDHEGAITDDKIVTKYPSLATMAKSLVSAAGRAAKDAALLKTITVPEEVKAVRLEACANCEKWNADDRRCTECGCKTDLKLSLATEQCPHPDGPRWTAHTGT